MGAGKSHISDIERGQATPSARVRAELDKVIGYGRLERLWDELTGSGREAWRYEITELTHQADALYEYQSLVFPVYLQTETYARALIRYGAPWLVADEVSARAEDRAKRARHMTEAATPIIWLVIDQTILWRRYGSASVQREQLEYVANLVDQDRLTLQMVPVDSPRHPGNNGPFRVITVNDDSPEVVYVESAHKGQVVTSPGHVSRYRMWFAALQGIAVGPDETLEALKKQIKGLEHE